MKLDQFTLPFLDTTSLGGGPGLHGGIPTARSPALPEMTFHPKAVESSTHPTPRSRPSLPTTATSTAIAVSPRAEGVNDETMRRNEVL
jgi:hypothetical protein